MRIIIISREIEYHNNKDSLEIIEIGQNKLNGVAQECSLTILCFSLYMSVIFT